MKIIVCRDYKEMSVKAAEIFLDQIRIKPHAVLGLATGSTPVGLYEELIVANQEGLDFSQIMTFNLDEYTGLSNDHPQSYHHFMQTHFFDHVSIPKENIHMPEPGIEGAADRYEEQLNNQLIDIQLLGLGENGHIAFNEPADELMVNTSLVTLSESTIKANSRFFNEIDDVPTEAISMGMGSIFRAKKIVILASGVKKHAVVQYLMKGDRISTYVPASLLLLHPDTTLIIDKEAEEGVIYA